MLVFTALLFLRPQDAIPPLAALSPGGARGDRGAGWRWRSAGCARAVADARHAGVARRAGARRRHPADRAVLDLAGRRGHDVHRPVSQGDADLPARRQHARPRPNGCGGSRGSCVIADGYLALPRGLRLRARRQPDRERPRARRGRRACSRTPTTWRCTWWRSCRWRCCWRCGRELDRRAAVAAAGGGFCMVGATIASDSRGGFLGLAGDARVRSRSRLARRPGLVIAGVGVLAVCSLCPSCPSSYWRADREHHRREPATTTGSRDARAAAVRRSVAMPSSTTRSPASAPGNSRTTSRRARIEAWQETHNVSLQVASELGIFGLAVFRFLVAGRLFAARQTPRLLPRAHRRPCGTPRCGAQPRPCRPRGRHRARCHASRRAFRRDGRGAGRLVLLRALCRRSPTTGRSITCWRSPSAPRDILPRSPRAAARSRTGERRAGRCGRRPVAVRPARDSLRRAVVRQLRDYDRRLTRSAAAADGSWSTRGRP